MHQGCQFVRTRAVTLAQADNPGGAAVWTDVPAAVDELGCTLDPVVLLSTTRSLAGLDLVDIDRRSVRPRHSEITVAQARC